MVVGHCKISDFSSPKSCRRRKLFVWIAPDLSLLDTSTDQRLSSNQTNTRVENDWCCPISSNNMTSSTVQTSWRSCLGAMPASAVPLNSAQVERWLDKHPAFTSDYFMRKATRQMVDAWILSHAIKQKLQYPSCSIRKQAVSVPNSRNTSGMTTPVRKISADEHGSHHIISGVVRRCSEIAAPIITDCEAMSLPVFDGFEPLRCQTSTFQGPTLLSCRCRLDLRLLAPVIQTVVGCVLMSSKGQDELWFDTCHRILQMATVALNAEWSSLFVVENRKQSICQQKPQMLRRWLGGVTASSSVEECSSCEDGMSFISNLGCVVGDQSWPSSSSMGAAVHSLAEFVAQTQTDICLINAHQDRRYSPDLDGLKGKTMDSLLSTAINDSEGHTAAVIQIVNKRPEGGFSSVDKELLNTFGQLCSLVLHRRRESVQQKLQQNLHQAVHDARIASLQQNQNTHSQWSSLLQHVLKFFKSSRAQLVICERETFCIEAGSTYDLQHCSPNASLSDDSGISIGMPLENAELCNKVITSKQCVCVGGSCKEKTNQFFTETPSASNTSCGVNGVVLCQCILNESPVFAIIQLIGKQNGDSFDGEDVENMNKLSPIYAAWIKNILSKQKLSNAVAKAKVLEEIVELHSQATQNEIALLNTSPLPTYLQLELDRFSLDDTKMSDLQTLQACVRMALDSGALERFRISTNCFSRWLLAVKSNYRPVHYHNWRHAFNVSHMMFAVLTKCEWWEKFGLLESFALVVACLCHDLDHRGTNNDFQNIADTPLSHLYKTSIMERHHLDRCLSILHYKGAEIFGAVSSDEYQRIVQVIESAILATDVSVHVRCRAHFFQLVDSAEFSWDSAEHKSLLQASLMTACDLSAIAKPWPIQYRVAQLVSAEFYDQGDVEHNTHHKQPCEFMDRRKMNLLPQIQVKFIDFICLPVFRSLGSLSSELQPLVEAVEENRSRWNQLALSSTQGCG